MAIAIGFKSLSKFTLQAHSIATRPDAMSGEHSQGSPALVCDETHSNGSRSYFTYRSAIG
jgi:hypothetical protein